MDTRVDELPARNEKFRQSYWNDYAQLPSLDNPHTPRGRVDDVYIRRCEEDDLSVSSVEQFRGQRNPYYPSPLRKECDGPYIEPVKDGKLVNETVPSGPAGSEQEATERPEDGLPQTCKQLSASRRYDIQRDSPPRSPRLMGTPLRSPRHRIPSPIWSPPPTTTTPCSDDKAVREFLESSGYPEFLLRSSGIFKILSDLRGVLDRDPFGLNSRNRAIYKSPATRKGPS